MAVILAAISRPDLVHIHGIGPAIVAPLARLAGLRVVVTHHGADYEREKWSYFARKVLKTGEWCATRFAHQIIAVSNEIHTRLSVRYGVKPAVVPNGVRLPSRTAVSIPPGDIRVAPGRYVLQVSRLVPEKRQMDLIDAFLRASLGPDWKLVLVGGIDDSEFASAILDRTAGREEIGVAGFRTGAELDYLYRNAGIFVLPSSHEGLPIALLEALSYGTRSLASNIPANLEVGMPEEFYFSLGDVDALAVALRRLASHPCSEEEATVRARWVTSKFNWNEIARATSDVFTRTHPKIARTRPV
jgi:glycosyltransferase involved in cell wall biosynthesis